MIKFASFKSLAHRKDGNVAMIFALTLIPMLLVGGFAIDAQVAFSKKGKVQHATDSAILAGARMMQNVDDLTSVTKHARDYFEAMIGSGESNLTCETLTVTKTGPEELTGSATCRQPTTLMRITGRDYVEFNINSTATYGTGRVDVAFVFDISGSMNTHGRIYDLKNAATQAADTLLPEPGSASDGDVRIAMVAYNNMIDAGIFFEDVTGLKKERWYSKEVTDTEWERKEVTEEGWYEECEQVCRRYAGRSGRCRDWDYQCNWEYGEHTEEKWVEVETTRTVREKIDSTCIYERGGDHAFIDTQPKQVFEPQLVSELEDGQYNAESNDDNSEAYMAASHLVWSDYRERWESRGEHDCLEEGKPFPLSHNQTQIDKYIDDLRANGGTAGHQGIAWGWYMINNQWSDVFDGASTPLDPSEPDVVKAMIIMTDGEFNEQFFDSQGNSTSQAETLCDAIKADDVIIYAVAFQAPWAGREVLEHCASGPEFFFNADNGQELMESYDAIATSISDLRIAH